LLEIEIDSRWRSDEIEIAGTKRPTTKTALSYVWRTGIQHKHAEVKMRIQHFGIVALFICITFATANTIEFRPVSKPATRAPFNSQEIVEQAKRVQRCDSEPESPIALVPANTVSSRLQKLVADDQAARMVEVTDLKSAEGADRIRRQEIVQYVLRNQLSKDGDFIDAGLIFQHGVCIDSFLLAHQLAGYAIALSESPTGNKRQASEARWLYAATYDRYLRNNGLPQRFGTQYRFDGPDCQYVLEPFDPKTTNEERTLYEVATFDPAVALASAAKCP
jgi:hypothetical protein